jgi:hypothetical protein
MFNSRLFVPVLGRMRPKKWKLFPRLIESETEETVRDVQSCVPQRLEGVTDRRDDPEPVSDQDQTDCTDVRNPQPGSLAARGMVVKHRLPTRMIEGPG